MFKYCNEDRCNKTTHQGTPANSGDISGQGALWAITRMHKREKQKERQILSLLLYFRLLTECPESRGFRQSLFGGPPPWGCSRSSASRCMRYRRPNRNTPCPSGRREWSWPLPFPGSEAPHQWRSCLLYTSGLGISLSFT